MSAIGKRVLISASRDVGQAHWNHWGLVVTGPEVQFGVRKYKVRIELQGRETVQKEVWVPVSALRVPKEEKRHE